MQELQLIIDDYIDYYNNDRCKWNLKKLTLYNTEISF
ncbi:IS3 family transposase [Blautia sp. M16]|uniref:IS3 family transposase n=2 Tax=Clostridia TaxID=186801 RepID=A0A8I0DPS0_9CLOT|nr:IS3 family transposase [Clostridium lentum]MBC5654836.1 IS3 family transposase [Blautia lenta]